MVGGALTARCRPPPLPSPSPVYLVCATMPIDVALFASEPQHVRQLQSAFSREQLVTVTHDWAHFEVAAPRSACSVVAIDRLRGSAAFSQLIVFKRRYPRHPAVLVTRWDAENARYLKDLVLEEVVWSHEITRELSTAVQRARSSAAGLLRSLSPTFEEADHLPRLLRRSLTFACQSEQPVRSVKQLAAMLACDRRTLSEQWGESLRESKIRLQDFIHWLLLLRALACKRPDQSWERVAVEVGVHPQSLGRWARRLARGSLPELAERGSQDVGRVFCSEVIVPILGGNQPDKMVP